jgi:hypothetical protein
MVMVLALTAPGSALAADQFDLICKGTVETFDGAIRPQNEHYRIDLKAARYCREDCSIMGKIQETTPDRIIFKQADNPSAGETHSHSVSRHTGDLTELILLRRSNFTWDVKSHCDIAPFSGLPKPRF